MIWLYIRQLFMKGTSLEKGIQAFIKANKGMTKSDGIKIINIFEDVKKNTAKVIKFPEDKITPFYKARPTQEELLEAKYRKLSSLSPEEIKVEMQKQGLTPVEEINKKLKKALDEKKAMFPGSNVAETEEQVRVRLIKQNRSNVQKSYLRQLDKKIMDEMDMTAKEMENMSSTALDDLRRNADPVGMKKQFDEITEGRGLGDFADDPFKEPDYASGGLARVGMFVGGPANPVGKGAMWFIKNLRQAYRELIEGKAFTNLDPMKREHLKYEILAQIKNIERGGPIPQDMINAMRRDPRFKDIMKTRSTDPELYEVEEIMLGKSSGKSDVDRMKDIQQKIELEDFDPKDRLPNAKGGLANILGV